MLKSGLKGIFKRGASQDGGERGRSGSNESNGGQSSNNANGGGGGGGSSSVRGGNGGNNGKPGSFSVDGGSAVFRVTVPDNVRPGDEFQVYAGNRIVRVRCPPGSAPGQSLQITVPTDPFGGGNSSRDSLGRSGSSTMPPDSDNASKIENSDPPAYMVTIPDGVTGGRQFPVTIQGQELMVTCPVNAGAGMQVRIVPPPPPTDLTAPPSGPRGGGQQQPGATTENGGGPRSSGAAHNSPNSSSSSRRSSSGATRKGSKKDKEQTQLFEVEVPDGVLPGHPFALLAGGVRVLVTCPLNAGPGQRIRFKLPLALTQKPKPENEAAAIKLSYDKDGWTRTIRVSDMKFQWVRMDDKGDVETNTRFDAEKSAYVRKLEFRPGTDPRIRDGVISLVPANEAFVDSRIKGANDEDLITYADIAEAQVKAFEEKAQWLQQKCGELCVGWNEGHMRMNVRRQYLLEDSVDAVMSLSRKDLRKLWRFEFIGEMGIDAGGLAREWFQLVTTDIFDPDMGLWQSSETNQMCMAINPASSKYIGVVSCSRHFITKRNDSYCNSNDDRPH